MLQVGRLIPAHAGKTLTDPSRQLQDPAHPRSRGENITRVVRVIRPHGSSPLTRGKPMSRAWRCGPDGLIPAHAGKTVVYCLPASAVAAHPRSRGENPMTREYLGAADGSSPLTRGKQSGELGIEHEFRLIPAHAGKTVTCATQAVHTAAHPRSRGENTAASRRTTARAGSSPLTRGKRTCPCTANSHRTAHPRSRGENSLVCLPRWPP